MTIRPEILGRLELIKSLRAVWPNEAIDFTPWLAKPENLSQLANAIGFGSDGLEPGDIEVPVGPFFADILCFDTRGAEPRNVVIENQLTKTDHDHLGKVVTYASVLKADYIIIVADEIRNEHRTALEWLNHISKDQFGFFAVEIQLWKIGESAIAPKFEVIVMPDEWLRNAQSRIGSATNSTMSEAQELNLKYWTAFCEAYQKVSGGAHWPRNPRSRNYLGVSIGTASFEINCVFNRYENWLRVELTLYGPEARNRIRILAKEKASVESKLGAAVIWDIRDDRTKQHIQVQQSNVDPNDESDWDRQHGWLCEWSNKFRKVFAELVTSHSDQGWESAE